MADEVLAETLPTARQVWCINECIMTASQEAIKDQGKGDSYEEKEFGGKNAGIDRSLMRTCFIAIG